METGAQFEGLMMIKRHLFLLVSVLLVSRVIFGLSSEF